MSGNIPYKYRVMVIQQSGNHCAIPTCRKPLLKEGTATDDPANIGKLAHIKGEKPGAARYDSDMTDEERNHHSNLIYVCANCHDMIDKQERKYTVEVLQEIKKKHDKWRRISLEKRIVEVGFYELDQVTRHIAASPIDSDDFKPIKESIPLKEKMGRNELTDKVLPDMQIGLLKAKEVGDYVDEVATADSQFPKRLKGGFVDQYSKLHLEGLRGDSLFNALADFANSGNYDLKSQAAGIAVLVYLFEKCEVFES